MKKILYCLTLLILSAGLCRAEGKIWAVLVGINQYEDAPALACCRNDVIGFRDLLVKAGADENCILLMTDDAIESQRRPTYTRMLNNVERWFKDKQVAPEDTFFFYFSGHGITKEGQDYLMPMDASRSYLDKTGYSLSTLHDLVRECKAGKVVVILDACRNLAEGKSGVQKSGFGGKVKGFTVESRADAKKIITIQSCSPDEISWEMPDEAQGVFSHYLIEGLRDPSKHSLSKLWAYVSEEVPAWARSKNKPDQTPMIQTNVADWQAITLLPATVGTQPPPGPVPLPTKKPEVGPGTTTQEQTNGAMGYVKSATQWSTRGDYDQTIVDSGKAIELDPKLAEAYSLRASAYNMKGQYDQAITDSNKAIELDPMLATAYDNRGAAYDNKGNYDQAITDLDKAIELDPKLPTAYDNRGVAYHNKKDYKRAIPDFDKAIELDPTLARAYSNRGSAYHNKGDYDRAIPDYDRAIELDPKFAIAYINRGNAYLNKKDYDRAIADYGKLIEIDPKSAVAYSNRGLAYVSKKDCDRAIADLDKAIELDPTLALAYNNRGVAYHNKKDYDRAIADYSKAIELDPKLAIAYQNRGNTYITKWSFKRAAQDFKKAKSLGQN